MSASPEHDNLILKVGIIGCGEIAQVVHIPTLLLMHKYFQITYLCDKSANALEHCASKLHDVKTTCHPEELCASTSVEAVLVINSDEYHAEHAVLALEHNKHVLVEKPVALTKADASAIADAEKKSRGKVMVGYMRRYAAPFEDAVKEIGGFDKILYARVRDIIGPNSAFVSQSGTFPEKFTDISAEDTAERLERAQSMVKIALQECGNVDLTDASARMWRMFCGLGSHDLSAMRETLGMPTNVLGSSLQLPFWNVLYKYPTFTLSYESGIDDIPRFDAHIEVYSAMKTVRVQFDTPYIKGLPVTLHITENDNGALKETKIIKSYEDPYTLELKTFYNMAVHGKAAKTTVEDAQQDFELFGMAMRHYFGN
ncbi:NAD(P)-binding protein [Pyrenochaeta sp. DS3sAY3a]|nr:NAD(P)-binding protein [Pyrenochaeta sp. DS3sAY3a]